MKNGLWKTLVVMHVNKWNRICRNGKGGGGRAVRGGVPKGNWNILSQILSSLASVHTFSLLPPPSPLSSPMSLPSL
jgi:hypothetical protein